MPSGEELAKQKGDFQLLPEDEYVLEVKEIAINKDQRNPYNDEVRDTLTVKFAPIKFADGQELVDTEGNDVKDDKLVFDFIDPTKIGMKPQPSKARKFFTACLGVAVGSGFNIDDYGDLIGSRVIGSIVVKNHPEKGDQNKVTSYRARPARPTRKAAPVEETETEDAATEAPAKAERTLPGEKKTRTRQAAKSADLDEDDDF